MSVSNNSTYFSLIIAAVNDVQLLFFSETYDEDLLVDVHNIPYSRGDRCKERNISSSRKQVIIQNVEISVDNNRKYFSQIIAAEKDVQLLFFS